MQIPFDAQLADKLAKLRVALIERKSSLYRNRHECVCDSTGLCAHHAEIANRLEEAIRRIDLAIVIANSKE